MPSRRLLLLSNSMNPGRGYLEHAEEALAEALGAASGRLAFVPYAGIRITPEAYAARVRERFGRLGWQTASVHEAADPAALIAEADAVVVGGGNTFELLRRLYAEDLLEAIRARTAAGAPYIGWSAGANVACPTIRTTNDMPVAEPPSLAALGLVGFQINPHFTDRSIPGHGGETRAERLEEFAAANPGCLVVGLPEGSWLRIEGAAPPVLCGAAPARIFGGGPPYDVEPGAMLSFLPPPPR